MGMPEELSWLMDPWSMPAMPAMPSMSPDMSIPAESSSTTSCGVPVIPSSQSSRITTHSWS